MAIDIYVDINNSYTDTGEGTELSPLNSSQLEDYLYDIGDSVDQVDHNIYMRGHWVFPAEAGSYHYWTFGNWGDDVVFTVKFTSWDLDTYGPWVIESDQPISVTAFNSFNIVTYGEYESLILENGIIRTYEVYVWNANWEDVSGRVTEIRNCHFETGRFRLYFDNLSETQMLAGCTINFPEIGDQSFELDGDGIADNGNVVELRHCYIAGISSDQSDSFMEISDFDDFLLTRCVIEESNSSADIGTYTGFSWSEVPQSECTYKGAATLVEVGDYEFANKADWGYDLFGVSALGVTAFTGANYNTGLFGNPRVAAGAFYMTPATPVIAEVACGGVVKVSSERMVAITKDTTGSSNQLMLTDWEKAGTFSDLQI